MSPRPDPSPDGPVGLVAAAVIGSLRVAEGMLLILEYRNKAREGRIADGRSQ